MFPGPMFGIPVISPSVDIEVPVGKFPLITAYVTVTAGLTAVADKRIASGICAGYVPRTPAGVFQIGCAILILT